MGPAFLLSLAEMSWGEDNKSAWTISLSSNEKLTCAHPSFSFRLGLIKQWMDFDTFCFEIPKNYADCIPRYPRPKIQPILFVANCVPAMATISKVFRRR